MNRGFLWIGFLSCFILQAQNTTDVVSLKNGSVVKGTVNEMSPSENIRQAKIISKLKQKLDWKNPDTNPVTFKPKYYRVENVPLFSYENIEYKIEIDSAYHNRNDLTSKIESTIFRAIESTNREQTSNETAYNISKNKSTCIFKISKVDFVFKSTGYQCNIIIDGKIIGKFNDPKRLPINYNIPFLAKSHGINTKMSKLQAFSNALENLKSIVKEFVFKYEPIAIEFVRIETDEKGKADKVVFKKPEYFLNTKNLNFIVIKPSDLSVKDEELSISRAIGSCVFSGEIIDGEIICKISDKARKNAFTKYIKTVRPLIAVSIILKDDKLYYLK